MHRSLPDLGGLCLVVAGDFVADEYLYGCTERISREAPVPIVRFERAELRLGGAANVAHNLVVLGARVRAVGALGRDAVGDEVVRRCRELGIDTRGLVRLPGLTTAVKTRILAGAMHTSRQQLLRLDRGDAVPPGSGGERQVLAALEASLKGADGLFVSDYGLGNAGALVARGVARWAKRLPVFVDSRSRLAAFKGATLAKPNAPELATLLGGLPAARATLARAADRLLRKQRWKLLLATFGRDGLALFRPGQVRYWAVHGSEEALDVTGAGDTVLAAFGAFLVASGDPELAAELANVAAGLVVQRSGTATVTPLELAAAAGLGAVRPLSRGA
jgi:rfaE bifunctional protein kinase chain/domain